MNTERRHNRTRGHHGINPNKQASNPKWENIGTFTHAILINKNGNMLQRNEDTNKWESLSKTAFNRFQSLPKDVVPSIASMQMDQAAE